MSFELDVTDPNLEIKRNYFIEASAGTGKTFAIEHLFVRLIEAGVSLDQILVVSFTNAATLELKSRIRRNLEAKKLKLNFDEAKIFTLHGFCYHTLQEYALESGFPLNREEKHCLAGNAKRLFKDFLRTGLCCHPKQLELVLKRFGYDLDKLSRELVSSKGEASGRSYGALRQEIRECIHELQLDSAQLFQELLDAAPSFSGMCDRSRKVKEEVIKGLKRFAALFTHENEDFFDLPIIRMVPKNLLAKKSYGGSLELLNRKLIPLLAELGDVQKILSLLKGSYLGFVDHVRQNEDLFFYDDLLQRMKECVEKGSFAEEVRSRYKAVLIDEFQDTDQVQWSIFSTLFFGHLPLYLVGDPKQSIYRFRGADLYTYMEAKQMMGPDAQATLVRNFRSDSALVKGLNSLFERTPELISLPKLKTSIPLLPIKPGLPESNEGKIIFCQAEDEETLFSFIVQEVDRLRSEEGLGLSACAVLVKDHAQASRFCAMCPLPVSLKKHESLLGSKAFLLFEDLLAAAAAPTRRELVIKVLAGPLFRVPLEQLDAAYEEKASFFRQCHEWLVSRGVLFFFRLASPDLLFEDKTLYVHMLQIAELVEERGGDLALLKQEDKEAELLRAWAAQEGEALQVMTIHVSKGLEFSAVFPVGLIANCDLQEEEETAEKMRQLYVALTRAKKRLYLPLLDKPKASMQLFINELCKNEPLEALIESHPSFSLMTCEKKQIQPEQKPLAREKGAKPTVLPTFSCPMIRSFTAMQEKREPEMPYGQEREEGIPAGVETGIVLHRLFERLDFTTKGESLRLFIARELKGTFLEPWQPQVEQMVVGALHVPLPGLDKPFCLAEVDPKKMKKEMQFCYPTEEPEGYMKGIIDLFFEHQGRSYILDWKSNALTSYGEKALQAAMEENDYLLQARLYCTSIRRYLALFDRRAPLEAAFFLFLRGLPKEGYYVYR